MSVSGAASFWGPYHRGFGQPIIDGYLGSRQSFAVTNNAAMYIV